MNVELDWYHKKVEGKSFDKTRFADVPEEDEAEEENLGKLRKRQRVIDAMHAYEA
jgi:hypothetical protein